MTRKKRKMRWRRTGGKVSGGSVRRGGQGRRDSDLNAVFTFAGQDPAGEAERTEKASPSYPGRGHRRVRTITQPGRTLGGGIGRLIRALALGGGCGGGRPRAAALDRGATREGVLVMSVHNEDTDTRQTTQNHCRIVNAGKERRAPRRNNNICQPVDFYPQHLRCEPHESHPAAEAAPAAPAAASLAQLHRPDTDPERACPRGESQRAAARRRWQRAGGADRGVAGAEKRERREEETRKWKTGRRWREGGREGERKEKREKVRKQ
jgi:hypothetical protein